MASNRQPIDPAAITPAGEEPRQGLRRQLLAALKRFGPPVLSVALFAVALFALRHELRHARLEDVAREVRSQPLSRLLLGLLLTAASYAVLTLYDLLGLTYLGIRLRYGRTALASFVGYAFSNTVGNALLVGTSARYRLYASWGLSALDVTKLVAFASATVWIGYCALGGVVFLAHPIAIPPSLHLPFATTLPVGVGLLAAAVAFLVGALASRRPRTLLGWEIELPRPTLAVSQVTVAALDWCLAGAVLYVLLPASLPLSWLGFLGVFLLAQLAGVASQVPGGLGVFETVFLLLVAAAEPGSVAGALILFRLLYYWLPLTVALFLLVSRELADRRAGLQRAGRALARALPAMAPPAFAAVGALVVVLWFALGHLSGFSPRSRGSRPRAR